MKTLTAWIGVVLVLFLSFTTVANACGDKFLVVGRGIRYERLRAAAHPGSILIYRNKTYEDTRAGTDLENALKKVGHTVQSVDDLNKLDATLKSGKFDIVILNLADTPLLEEQIIASPSKPAVLPIIYDRTGKEVEAAGKKYDCILKASGHNTNVLSVVDEAVGEKKQGAPVKCKWSK